MPLPKEPIASGVEDLDKTSDIAERIKQHEQKTESANFDSLKNPVASAQTPEFVRERISAVQEKSSSCRQNVGLLMSTLMRKCVVSDEHYLEGVTKLVRNVQDNPPTSPDVWVNLAESIVPVISTGMVKLSQLHQIAGPPVNAPRLLTEVLALLVNEKGQDWIDSQWDVDGAQWTDFLEASIQD